MGESIKQILRVLHQWYRISRITSEKMQLHLKTIFFVICLGNIARCHGNNVSSSESDLDGVLSEEPGLGSVLNDTSTSVGSDLNDTVEVNEINNDTKICSEEPKDTSISILRCPDVLAFDKHFIQGDNKSFEIEIESVGGVFNFPQHLGQIHMESLTISEAKLTFFNRSSETQFLKSLKKMDLSGNPDFDAQSLVNLTKLESLTHLSMRGSALKTLDEHLPYLLKNLPNLEYLNVHSTGITYLGDPDIFNSNKKLKHLDISGNDKLSVITFHADFIHQMIYLDISNCVLRIIKVEEDLLSNQHPQNQKDVGIMEVLDVSNNRLKEIPPSLLSALSNNGFSLNISGNDFGKASENCLTFHLWHFLQSLPTDVGRVHVIGKHELSFKKEIALSKCQWNSCPPGCQCNSKKKIVDCSNIGLKTLPQVGPSSAEILLLQNNNLTTLEGIHSAAWCNLKILDVGYNNVSRIFYDRKIQGNCKCETKEAYSNEQAHCFPQNLEEIHLNNNTLQNFTKNDCLLLSPLNELDLSGNKMKTLASICDGPLNYLETLTVTGNTIGNISVNDIYQYPKLKTLHISEGTTYNKSIHLYRENLSIIVDHRKEISLDIEGPSPSTPLTIYPAIPLKQSPPTPAEPSRTNSSEAYLPTPAEPSGTNSSEASPPTPAKPSGTNSSEAFPPTPAEPSGTNSSEASPPTPAEPSGTNSSEASPPTPAETSGTNSSEASPPTPAETSGTNSSEASPQVNGTPNPQVCDELIRTAVILVIFIILVLLTCYIIYLRNSSTCIKRKFEPQKTIAKRRKYDCFVVCSSEDFTRVREMIIVPLSQRGYSIAWHENAFVPGDWIMHNVERAVQNSSQMMIFGTQNLVSSRWGLHEIRRGCHEEFVNPDYKVLALVDETLPKTLNRDLYDIVCLRTHIKLTDPDYIEQICRFLPPQELPENSDLQPDNLQESLNDINEFLERYEEIRRKETDYPTSQTTYKYKSPIIPHPKPPTNISRRLSHIPNHLQICHRLSHILNHLQIYVEDYPTSQTTYKYKLQIIPYPKSPTNISRRLSHYPTSKSTYKYKSQIIPHPKPPTNISCRLSHILNPLQI
ncbi:uncharacterized protein [Palaemon carinicauda]|uniref:uncharacterized protein n=1 Tax=Palaemon carinicauda TaxID=392227 RepID=UPI0035B6A53B